MLWHVCFTQIYATSTGAAGGLPALEDEAGNPLEPFRLCPAQAFSHAHQYSHHYAAALRMQEGQLRGTLELLQSAATQLAEKPLHDSVCVAMLERAFSYAERLAVKCNTPYVEDNLHELRKQWDDHTEAKRLRLQRVGIAMMADDSAAGSSGLNPPAGAAGGAPARGVRRLSPAGDRSPSPRARQRRRALQPAASPAESSLTSEPAGQDAELIDGQPAVEAVRAADSLQGVQALMQAHALTAVVQSEACKAVANMLARDNGPIHAEAGNLGLLSDVRKAMRQHTGRSRVQKHACKALTNMMGYTGDNDDEAGRLELLTEIHQAMRTHPASVSLQEAACRAVANITSSNDENRKKAARHGLMKEVQKAMRRHPDSRGLQTHGIGAIVNITAQDSANQGEAGRIGLLRDIQRAMHQHRTSADVQEEACQAVGNIAAGSLANRKEAGWLGIFKDIQQAMRLHSGAPAVLRRACGAIGNICTDDACYSIARLVEDHIPNQVTGGRLSILKEVQAAMRAHLEAEDVMLYACYALRHMTVSTDNEVEAGRIGMLADLQGIMRKYTGNEYIQEQACAAIINLTDNEENKARAVQLHMLEDLQRALRLHASREVQTHAVAAVRGLVDGNLGCQARGGEAGPAERGGRRGSGPAAGREQLV
eukprot:jgi/Tetstr1/458423/TSEL_044858.t1